MYAMLVILQYTLHLLVALVLPLQQIYSLLIFNSATKSPKILKNISKFKLIIADLEKNSHSIIYLKQLVSKLFKPVAFFFWDTRYILWFCHYLLKIGILISVKDQTGIY